MTAGPQVSLCTRWWPGSPLLLHFITARPLRTFSIKNCNLIRSNSITTILLSKISSCIFWSEIPKKEWLANKQKNICGSSQDLTMTNSWNLQDPKIRNQRSQKKRLWQPSYSRESLHWCKEILKRTRTKALVKPISSLWNPGSRLSMKILLLITLKT